MTTTETDSELLSYPSELLAAAVLLGERDAENVYEYLTSLIAGWKENGFLGDAVIDLSLLHGDWLLDLAAALRLIEWEGRGLARDHLRLPSAQEALAGVLQRFGQPDPQLVLCRTVLHAYFNHFAWTGVLDLGADLVLEPLDEEMLATQLADFLWEHRHVLETKL